MFLIVYGIILRVYRLGIYVASLFNKKARLWIQGRKNLIKQIKEEIGTDEKIIWVHCASLGEFEQGRPVIEAIKKNRPSWKILLTFFSPSGYEIRKNYSGADYIFYLPLDTGKNAREFLQAVKPTTAIFVKYEFWYHYLKELKKNNIPAYLVSGIFRKKQWFFRWYGAFFRRILRSFNFLFVQNQESARLLKSIGILQCSVAGDTRFDRVYDIAMNAKPNVVIEKFTGRIKVIVAGSTWKQDEELLIKYINDSEKKVRWIIAPHEIHKENILRIRKEIEKSSVTYSTLIKNPDIRAEVLIIDNIGILSSIYRHGNIAYVGGGFGKGIHNILEPATFGMPVVFGPNYKKFREACELVEKGGAIPVTNYSDLKRILDKLILETEAHRKAGDISKEYIKNNLGSTQLIVDKLLNN